MSADPTAEHIDAVALLVDEWLFRMHGITSSCDHRTEAEGLLTSTDPAVHAALAASLPAEVMLAALVDRGTLTAEGAPIARHGGHEHAHWQQRWDGQHTHEGRRFVTPWEVAK